ASVELIRQARCAKSPASHHGSSFVSVLHDRWLVERGTLRPSASCRHSRSQHTQRFEITGVQLYSRTAGEMNPPEGRLNSTVRKSVCESHKGDFMHHFRTCTRFLALPLIAVLLTTTVPTAPARAALIATEDVLHQANPSTNREKVAAFLQRQDV